MSNVLIHKASGDGEPFDPEKLRRSLRNTGANDEEIARAMTAVERQLRRTRGQGISTKSIFQTAHRSLRRARRPVAARYNLRRAVERLGPSGFPFEQLYGELLRAEGWQPEVGVVLHGKFVSHEVDVDARRGKERVLCECKFRRDQRSKIDVRIALYVHARSQDLQAVDGGYSAFHLVTNGRFTSDAVRYGEGVGLVMLGWSHPTGAGLRERIERAGLHPITCLTDLQGKEQKMLLKRGIVLCRQLMERMETLEDLGIPDVRLHRIRGEVDQLLNVPKTHSARR